MAYFKDVYPDKQKETAAAVLMCAVGGDAVPVDQHESRTTGRTQILTDLSDDQMRRVCLDVVKVVTEDEEVAQSQRRR